MKRPVTLAISVVLLALGGLMCLALAALMGWAMFALPENSGVGFERIPAVFKFLPVATFGAGALWMLATAMGLWKLHRWARISMLVFSAVLVMMQGFGVLFLFFFMPGEMPSADPALMAGVRAGMAIFYGAQVAVGIWWLVYFNLAHTKQLFATGAAEANARELPLSIAVIAWHLVAGGAMCVVFAWLVWPAMIFGAVLKGWAAAAAYLVVGTLSLFVGLALLKRHPQAVDWSLYYFGFWTAHAIVIWTAVPQEKLARDMAEFLRLTFPETGQSPVPMMPAWVNVTLGLLMMAIPYWYLLTRRKAYLAACAAAHNPAPTTAQP